VTLPDLILEHVRGRGGTVEADDVLGYFAERFRTEAPNVRTALTTLRTENLVHWTTTSVVLPGALSIEDKPPLPEQIVAWLGVRGGELDSDVGKCAEIIATDLGVPPEKVARAFRDLWHDGRIDKRSKTRIGTLHVALRKEERSHVKEQQKAKPVPVRNGSTLVPYSAEFRQAVTAVVDIVEILRELPDGARPAVLEAINERFAGAVP